MDMRKLTPDEVKKITSLFEILMEIDLRSKRKEKEKKKEKQSQKGVIMSTRELRSGMPKADAILKYWKKKLGVKKKQCFACGSPFKLHRTHIIPLIFGGTNALENLHLLCVPCHEESEGLKVYDIWFEWQRKYEWEDMYGHAWNRLQKLGITHEQVLTVGKKNKWNQQKTSKEILATLHWKS